jgi:hypothetical protein
VRDGIGNLLAHRVDADAFEFVRYRVCVSQRPCLPSFCIVYQSDGRPGRTRGRGWRVEQDRAGQGDGASGGTGGRGKCPTGVRGTLAPSPCPIDGCPVG